MNVRLRQEADTERSRQLQSQAESSRAATDDQNVKMFHLQDGLQWMAAASFAHRVHTIVANIMNFSKAVKS